MSKIREAQPEDIEQLIQISTSLGYEEMSAEFAKRNISQILNSNTDRIWVYEEEEIIKGWLHIFIALRLASSNFAEIGGLAIKESSRRTGIGRKLVEKAMQWATSNQLPVRVRCNTIRSDANKFYEDVGFIFKKEQRVYEKRS